VSSDKNYKKLATIVDEQLSKALENNKPKEAIEILNNMIKIIEKIHEKGSRMTEEQATEEPETATIQSKLHGLMDSDNKAKSIKALRSALEQLDEDKFEGISDVTDAIDEYDDIGRAGLSAEEYADDKQTAFDEIDEAIDGITETEEE
jgi:flagellar motor component MotA